MGMKATPPGQGWTAAAAKGELTLAEM